MKFQRNVCLNTFNIWMDNTTSFLDLWAKHLNLKNFIIIEENYGILTTAKSYFIDRLNAIVAKSGCLALMKFREI